MTEWKSKNRHKYLLQYHVIFVCKYRKKLLSLSVISDAVKHFSSEICRHHGITIRYMETDKDHIHYMLETSPNMSVSKAIRLMKGYTTFWLWKTVPDILSAYFWRERTFWTDGYFACSIGNVSESTLKEYISNQG